MLNMAKFYIIIYAEPIGKNLCNILERFKPLKYLSGGYIN